MAQPEISRRCLTCGASVRASARFCAQCGKTLGAKSKTPPVENADEIDGSQPEVPKPFEGNTHTREARRTGELVIQTLSSDEIDEAVNPSRTPDPNANTSPGAAQPTFIPSVQPETRVIRDDAVTPKTKIATAVGATGRLAANLVKDSIVPRVERVREVSVVILEDAPDDSGLRFVIIAAVLFVLFLVLLIVSTVIK
jgi:hypothetical protein